MVDSQTCGLCRGNEWMCESSLETETDNNRATEQGERGLSVVPTHEFVCVGNLPVGPAVGRVLFSVCSSRATEASSTMLSPDKTKP